MCAVPFLQEQLMLAILTNTRLGTARLYKPQSHFLQAYTVKLFYSTDTWHQINKKKEG